LFFSSSNFCNYLGNVNKERIKFNIKRDLNVEIYLEENILGSKHNPRYGRKEGGDNQSCA
jgi:hypothetical protein